MNRETNDLVETAIHPHMILFLFEYAGYPGERQRYIEKGEEDGKKKKEDQLIRQM